MVIIPKGLLERLKKLLLEAYPYEGCGLLIGLKGMKTFEVQDCYPVANAWPKVEERRRRFAIDPKDFLLAERVAESKGLSLIGVYHSHPDYPAEPSAFDAEYAWEGFVYLIFSLKRETINDFKAFIWKENKGFEEIKVCLKNGEGGEACL